MAACLATHRRRERRLGRAARHVDRHRPRIRRLAEPAAFPGWAYQIASHKCRDWLRRQRRHRQIDELYSAEVQESYQPAGEPEEYATLKEALDQLSSPDRTILSLRYEEDFNTAEIAAILTIPEGTVKSRLFHARKRLRQFSGEYP